MLIDNDINDVDELRSHVATSNDIQTITEYDKWDTDEGGPPLTDQFLGSIANEAYQGIDSRRQYIYNQYFASEKPLEAATDTADFELTYQTNGFMVYKRFNQANNIGSGAVNDNPQAPEYVFCFRGTDSIVDAIKDANILLANSIPYSVFQADVEALLDTIKGILQVNTDGTPQANFDPYLKFRFTSHSYGGMVAICVYWEMFKLNIIQQFAIPPHVVNFNPAVYPVDKIEEMIDFITRGKNNEQGYLQYSNANELITNYIVKGDVVSALYPFYGIGHTFVRPNKVTEGNLLSSLSYYTNVPSLNTFENHHMDNWITAGKYDKRPGIITEIPFPIEADGNTYDINQHSYIISSHRRVTFDGHHQPVALQSTYAEDGVTKVQAVNIYTTTTDPTSALKYKWNFQEQSDNTRYVVTQETDPNDATKESRFLYPLYEITNESTNSILYIRLQTHKYIIADDQRNYYRIILYNPDGSATGNAVRIANDITGTNVHHENGYPIITPSATSYETVDQATTRKLGEWTLFHYSHEQEPISSVQDGLSAHAGGDLRRFFHQDLNVYVQPAFSSGNYASIPLEQSSLKNDLLSTPQSQLFMIESMKYPGEYLRYNASGNPHYINSGDNVNGLGLYYLESYKVESTTISNATNDFRFYMDNGELGYIKSLNTPSGSHIATNWHGGVGSTIVHGIMTANGSSDIFCIDYECSLTTSNSTTLGLLYIYTNKYLGLPYYLENGNRDTTNNSMNVNNVPLEAQFKIVWI